MADAIDTKPLEDVIRGLMQPLALASDSPEHATRLLLDLGYLPPSVAPALGDIGPILASLDEGLAQLRAAIEADDDTALAVAITRLVVDIGRLFAAVESVVDGVQAAYAGTGFAAAIDLVSELPQRLVDYLIVRFLETEYPTVQAGLVLLGIITNEDVPAGPTAFHAPYRRRAVNWNQIPDVFTDPRAAINAVLWNGNSLRYLPLLSILHRLATALGLPAGYASPQYGLLTTLNDGADLTVRPEYDRLLSLDFPLYRDQNASVGLEIYPVVNTATGDVEGLAAGVGLGVQVNLPLGDWYALKLKASAAAGNLFGVRLKRGASPTFVSDLLGANPAAIAASLQFGASLAVEPTDAPSPQPLVRVGVGASRFEIGSGALRLGIERFGKERFFVEGELRKGQIVLKSNDADGFLAKILPAEGIQSNFDLGIGFATDAGLYFTGSSGLEIQLPAHIELGPIEIVGITIAVKLRAKDFPVEFGATIKGELGPLKAVVENVGVRAVFSFPPGGGNMGPLELAFGFKPPNGVGLSIDAGVVKGGGYLFIDPDRGEYAGALELTIADFLSLKAIGLITTKMPDGRPGFALLIIITAEFTPGVQLGYGFNLIGVGGLLGLNRTVVLEALATGVRTGAVNGILFPVDPVANAPRIISDLRAIFPPYESHFLIGPMAKIGWGGSLITLALGVIIEIPGNIAILGILRLSLPDPDEPVLQLQVNFIGAIEFDKKRGWFFAALYESRLLFITIEGEIGILIAVGDDANFVLSAGGFHPSFSPPPLPFPSPRRIALDVINTPYARLRADTYFAITTNTVQFGAHVEAYFGFDSFGVQGNLSFDALVRFSPFYFIIEMSARASLQAFGVGVFSLDLEFSLEGVTPWRAKGRGSIHLLFFKISADFDVTWGESRDTALPPVAVVPLLTTEIDNAINWRALPPPSHNLLVSLRKLELAADALVLHPLGTLEISQSAVPLGITIDKVGAQQPSDANRLGLTVAGVGLIKRSDTRRKFAPAQFRNMSDAEKLQAPAFQDQVSGLVLGVDGAELRTGRAVKRSLRYEVTTIDTLYRRRVRRFFTLSARLFGHLVKNAAISRSGLSRTRRKAAQPFDDGVSVSAERFAVVSTEDNRVAAGTTNFASEGEAREWLRTAATANPGAASQLQVVPLGDVAEAA